jgi:hypothetical protein
VNRLSDACKNLLQFNKTPSCRVQGNYAPISCGCGDSRVRALSYNRLGESGTSERRISQVRLMRLFRSNRDVRTVFDLLGDKENDMTFGLGWCFAISAVFLAKVLKHVSPQTWKGIDQAIIRLQTGRGEHGITDLEVDLLHNLAVIFEAKLGPQLPTEQQLGKYAKILKASSASEKHLVAITNATHGYVQFALPEEIGGIPLHHRSWAQIRDDALDAAAQEGHAAKRWLRQFSEYLGGVLQMERRFSNRVYVVSLAVGNPQGWKISWVDIIVKRRRYFYPIGSGGWPDPPPNYIAFRYSGRLQSLHHVESWDSVQNPHSEFPEAPDDDKWGPCYCLKLGPPIKVPSIPAGPKINFAARRWCMIDTLFTSKTISDAEIETKRRERLP